LDFILKKSAHGHRIDLGLKKRLLKHLTYFQGDLAKPESFKGLAAVLKDRDEARAHTCYNRLFYFATSPQLFASLARVLKDKALLMACQNHARKIRVLVEKPFGFNLASARSLNRLLLKFFTEDQIYRIDHYQGKETVQNLMVARFANAIFEPLWNNRYVDHVQVSVFETDTAANRAEYYEQTGALKDMVQNHMLQVLALLLMDEPKELAPELIRDEKSKILSALRPFNPKDFQSQLVLGQYEGFKKDVENNESRTESYVALKTFVDTPRWQNVPIYLRTGKGLSQKTAEVSVHFKELPRCLFRGCAGNIMTFQIQPTEAVYIRINNKQPGYGIELHQTDLEFSFSKHFKGKVASAYERLLLDFIQGDQRLFIRSDEIEASWKFIDSLTQSQTFKKLPIESYPLGSLGPEQAEEMIKNDSREWLFKNSNFKGKK
jgi:glucose-6-phosphate 1-dehydrogenase